jgi:hypothetical protein
VTSARLKRLCFSLRSALCRGQGPATAPLARGASCQHAAARACGSAREVCAGSHVSRSSPASRYHADASNQELGVARGTLCTVQATVRQSAPTLKVTRHQPQVANRTPHSAEVLGAAEACTCKACMHVDVCGTPVHQCHGTTASAYRDQRERRGPATATPVAGPPGPRTALPRAAAGAVGRDREHGPRTEHGGRGARTVSVSPVWSHAPRRAVTAVVQTTVRTRQTPQSSDGTR